MCKVGSIIEKKWFHAPSFRVDGFDKKVRRFAIARQGSGYPRLASHVFAARTLASGAWRRPDHILSTHVNFGSVDALHQGLLGMLVDPNDVSAITAGIRSVLEKKGPPLWFNRNDLRDEVQHRFGRAAFRRCLTTQLRLAVER